MILTNQQTGESYYNCYPTFIAEKIGINPITIKRWRLKGFKVKQYGDWSVFFQPHEVKQFKGFARVM